MLLKQVHVPGPARVGVCAHLMLLAALCSVPNAAAQNVVEFYNADLDNYFITADPAEQAMVDSGAVGRWTRTASGFNTGGSNAVCRFYGNGNINHATGTIFGPNSHFYTADPAECAGLKSMFDPNAKSWKFESNDFLTSLPAGGKCAPLQIEVYRAYNNGFARGVDSNHRITSNLAAYQQTVAAGWSGEGVVMCAPGFALAGSVFFGTVSGAMITASSVVNGAQGAPLGSTTTDASGNFNIPIGSYLGPVLITASGGTYKDVVKDTAVNLASPLRAAIPSSFGAHAVTVTPLTESVVQNAQTNTGGLTPGNILGENQRVQQQLGFDPAATAVMPPSAAGAAAAGDAVKAYSAYVAGVSQYISESAATMLKLDGKAATLQSATADYAAAIKAGGIATNDSIAAAQNDFLVSTKNATGVTNIVSLQRISAGLAANNIAFPSFGPDISISGNGSVASGVGVNGYATPTDNSKPAQLFASLWQPAAVGQTVVVKRPQDYTALCQGGATHVQEKFGGFSGACQGSGDCIIQIAPGGNYQVREDWTYQQLACAPDFAGQWRDGQGPGVNNCGITQPLQLFIVRSGDSVWTVTGTYDAPTCGATATFSGSIQTGGALSLTIRVSVFADGSVYGGSCSYGGTAQLSGANVLVFATGANTCGLGSGELLTFDRVP